MRGQIGLWWCAGCLGKVCMCGLDPFANGKRDEKKIKCRWARERASIDERRATSKRTLSNTHLGQLGARSAPSEGAPASSSYHKNQMSLFLEKKIGRQSSKRQLGRQLIGYVPYTVQ